jgi:hypothetical protein
MPGGNFVQFTEFFGRLIIRTAARGRYADAMHAGMPERCMLERAARC